MEIIKIPAARIGVLLGEEGNTKKLLERKCKVKIAVNADGDVEIDGDSADVFFAKDVVRAMGRGFDVEDALLLLKETYQFQLIDLKDVLKSDKAITRIKGRIIGEKGKMKMEIESAADCKLSIYGFTVGIIAPMDSVDFAREALERMINGGEHAGVIAYLSKVKKDLFVERLRSK